MGSKWWWTYANEGHIPDKIDHGMQLEFMGSFNTPLLLEATNTVNELKQVRNKKLKKSSEKTLMRSRITMKGDITQCLESFTEVAKSLIGSTKAITPTNELRDSIKAAIGILNNTDNVKVASPFWVNATEVPWKQNITYAAVADARGTTTDADDQIVLSKTVLTFDYACSFKRGNDFIIKSFGLLLMHDTCLYGFATSLYRRITCVIRGMLASTDKLQCLY